MNELTAGYDTAHFYCTMMPGQAVTQDEAPDAPILPKVGGRGPDFGVPTDLNEARIFIASYADHQIAISNLRFENIGQLVRDQDGKVKVRPMCQQAIQLPGPPWMIGPHQVLQEALFGYWDKQVEAARTRGHLNLRSYLTHLDKKRILRSYGQLSREPKATYIKHADEAMFQYLWQDGSLTAVLDWEWSVPLPHSVKYTYAVGHTPQSRKSPSWHQKHSCDTKEWISKIARTLIR